MSGYEDDVFALPISGHYDIGYSYGSSEQQAQQQTPPQSLPIRTRNPRYGSVDTMSHRHARSRSPPTVLPLSFTTPRQASLPTLPLIPESGTALGSYRPDSLVDSPIQSDLGTTPTPYDPPPPVPPKAWARSHPSSPRRLNAQPHGSESDLSTASMRSRQESSQSADTTQSSSSSCSIEPDQLPSHSHPQWLSATQSAAFAGPRPIQPMRLCRRELVDSHSGEAIFRLSDETKLKLSRQAIYQIFEPGSSAIVGTLGYATDASDEVAAILRGQDVVLKKESPSSSRWCFTPSNCTKKNVPWYWMKDKLRGDIVLSDAKKNGNTIARIQRDVLSYERAGLSLDTVNEICFSAMALAELARRSTLYEDCPTLATAIAVVALGDALADKHSDEDTFVPAKPKRKLTLLR